MLIALVVTGGAVALSLIFARLGRGSLPATDGEGVRFGGFNALRALAAIGVVAGHTLATSPLVGLPHFLVENMATGVALFFVISGFLLYRPFAASLTAPSKVSVTRFALNRALRILPLYVLVVVVVYLAGLPIHSPVQLLRALTFTGVYSGDDLVPVAWSLDDEVAFYLLLPVLFVVLIAWPWPSQRLWLGAGVIAVLCVISLAMLAASPGEQAIIGGPIAKFHQFGLGMLLATLHVRWPRFALRPRILVLAGAGILAALTVSSVAFDRGSYFFSPVCGFAYFLVVAVVAFSGPATRLTRTLSWAPILLLGDVSYGIYLWHEPLHHVLFNLSVLSSSYVLGFFELACCTIALASGTYFLVEKPALGIKRRWAVGRSPQSGLAPAPVAAL
jgi:peptidoglycan/LPS O-acetylase OafA/YrhL